MTNSIADALADALEDGGWRAKARPSQLPPPGIWNGWAVVAGRGFGKNFQGGSPDIYVRSAIKMDTHSYFGLN